MSDTQATLLLTRPAQSSSRFLALCETAAGRRLPVVVSPLIEIVEAGTLPDLSSYATIVVTSRHAVQRLGEAGVLRGRRLACVGEATADLARRYGADADALGPDVDGFLERASELAGPCLYCRGVHVATDLAAALSERGSPTDEAVVYDQVARPLSAAARTVLSGRDPVVVPVFSKRSGALLQAARPFLAPLKIVAISDSVAQSWSAGGAIRVAREPNMTAMVEATIGEF